MTTTANGQHGSLSHSESNRHSFKKSQHHLRTSDPDSDTEEKKRYASDASTSSSSSGDEEEEEESVKFPVSPAADDSHELNMEIDDDDDEDGSSVPKTPPSANKRRQPGKPRSRGKPQSVERLASDLGKAQPEPWKVGNQFEITQDQARRYGSVAGKYLITDVPQIKGKDTDCPVRTNDRGEYEVDWEALKKKKNSTQYYAAAILLGHSADETREHEHDYLLRMGRHEAVPDTDTMKRMDVFLLPPRDKIPQPVYVTLDNARTIEKYGPNNRFKSDSAQKRWELASKGPVPNVDGKRWALLIPQPLYSEHAAYVANLKRPKAPSAAATAAPATPQQQLESKLDSIKKEFPNMDLVRFMPGREPIIDTMLASATATFATVKTTTEFDHVKATWDMLAKMHQKSGGGGDVAKWREQVAQLSEARRKTYDVFEAALLYFDPRGGLAVASALERIAKTLPVSADKDLEGGSSSSGRKKSSSSKQSTLTFLKK